MKQNHPQRVSQLKLLEIGHLARTGREWCVGTQRGHPTWVGEATSYGWDSETMEDFTKTRVKPWTHV